MNQNQYHIPEETAEISSTNEDLEDARLVVYRPSLVVQWVRLRAPSAGGPGSILHLVGELDPTCMPQLSSHAATKDPAQPK